MGDDRVSRISVSLPPGLLKDFDEACRRAGFGDRSKAVQMALRSFISEHQSGLAQRGRVSGVILLAYDPGGTRSGEGLGGGSA